MEAGNKWEERMPYISNGIWFPSTLAILFRIKKCFMVRMRKTFVDTNPRHIQRRLPFD